MNVRPERILRTVATVLAIAFLTLATAQDTAIPRAIAQEAPPTAPVQAMPDLGSVIKLPDEQLRAAIRGSLPSPELDAAALAEVAAFEARLSTWLTDMQALEPLLRDAGDGSSAGYLAQVEQRIDTMNPQDLLQVGALLGEHQGFWQLPEFIAAALDPSQVAPPWYRSQLPDWVARGALDHETAVRMGMDPNVTIPQDFQTWGSLPATELGPDAAFAPDAVPTPNATATVPFPTMPQFPPRGDLPDDPDNRAGCPGQFRGNTCDACPVLIPLPAIFAVSLAQTIATAVTDALDADTDAAVPPLCVVASIPNPVYYVANSIRIALEYALRALIFANELALECEGNLHAAVAHLFMDQTVSSRVTQKSMDAHARQQLRLYIEMNLLRQTDDNIALFQLPAAACGSAVPNGTAFMSGFEGFRFCGQLELVREVVQESLQRYISASAIRDVLRIQNEIAAGDDHYMNGRWRSAYERYRNAYRFTVREEIGR